MPIFSYNGSRCFASPYGFDCGLRPPLRMTHRHRIARVILSGAKRNRTFSSEIPNDATHRLILAMLGFRLLSPRVILSERSESNCIAAPSGATVESRGELRSG